MEPITSIFKRISDFFHQTEKKKLILLGALALAIITAGIVGAALLNHVEYTALYSDLSAEEAGTIMSKLEEMGVSAKAKGSDTILVPAKQADELRIELASQGYPNTGLNYDLFSNSSDLGSTDLEQQTYLQYQLQENMRQTISRMDKVDDCIVIVNLASNSSFVRTDNTSEASVAVLLDLEQGEKLSDEEAETIGKFVLKCVPKLQKDNISIVDSQMNYYSIDPEEDGSDSSGYSDSQQKLTEQMKQILSEQVLRVLEPALGSGNIAVSVNLNLNFDKQTVDSVSFSPPVEGESQGLLISSQEIYDGVTGDGTAAASGEAGTDSNGVSASEYVSGSQGTQGSESYTKTYNYELNQIQTQIENAQGAVQDLSVAVLINSDVDGVDGYMDQIKSLVANAIGVNADYISVEVMPFLESAGGNSFADYLSQNQKTMAQLTTSSILKTVIIAASLILIIFMILRFLGVRKPHRGGENSGLTEPVAGPVPGAPSDQGGAPDSEQILQEMMNKQSNETERVEELMDKYPDAVVQTLRSWLLEDK